MKLKTAIIGIGGMGRKYANMIGSGEIEGMELACICTRNPQTRAELQEQLGVTAYEKTADMYRNADTLDAVIICTPHPQHYALTMEAFSHGKHVLCEKPASAAIGEAREMAEEADERGLAYGLVFHNRLLPAYQYVKRVLDNGELGALKRIRVQNTRFFRTHYYHASGSWRSSWQGEGGGALINQGQHVLDLWQWLFGLPESLRADIPFGKYNDFMVDDEVSITMKYPDKLSASFFISTGELPWEETIEIVGTCGKIVSDGKKLTRWQFGCDTEEYLRTEPAANANGVEVNREDLEFCEEPDLYQQLFQNFADHIRIGVPLTAPGQEGTASLELCNGAYLSAWTGREIALPVDAQLYQAWLNKKIEEEKGQG